MITIRTVALAALTAMGSTCLAAAPTIEIWKSEQVGRFAGYVFPVSVGSSTKPTPTGKYTVKKKVVDYWSKKYDRPMPYSVFFTDAHAIHSGDLYTPSKGCIRVDRSVAPWLYSYAKPGKTKVVIYP